MQNIHLSKSVCYMNSADVVEMSVTGLLVLSVIENYISTFCYNNYLVWNAIPLNVIMENLPFSKRTVQVAIKTLEELEYLDVKSERGASTQYKAGPALTKIHSLMYM